LLCEVELTAEPPNSTPNTRRRSSEFVPPTREVRPPPRAFSGRHMWRRALALRGHARPSMFTIARWLPAVETHAAHRRRASVGGRATTRWNSRDGVRRKNASAGGGVRHQAGGGIFPR